MPLKKTLLTLALSSILTASFLKSEENWISLFNGKDLSGWTPKFAGHKLGTNYKNIFRVEDGLLKVDYSEYGDSWKGEFGHLFSEKKYSHYRIRLEYRFTGKQVPGAPKWAVENNGIMLHCQDPETMRIDQDFPVSLEFQLLGAGNQTKTTGNLCTPGTYASIDGRINKNHCINSSEPTRPLGEWVTAEAEVRGGQVIKHFINGKKIFEYTDLKLDPEDPDAAARIELDGTDSISEGWISLQAESHP